MAPSNQTSHNKAEGHSRQINATSTNYGTQNVHIHQYLNITTTLGSRSVHPQNICLFIAQERPDLAVKLVQQEEGSEVAAAFLQSMIQSPKPSYRHINDVPTANVVDVSNDTAIRRLGPQSPNGVPQDNMVLGSSWLEVDLPWCIEQYLTPGSSQRVLDVLAKKDREEVDFWRNSDECDNLFVRRNTCKSASDWTTDLTLEIVGVIIGENETSQQYRPILAHFCKQRAAEKKWGRGGLMVHDFIDQLRNLRTKGPRSSEQSSERPRDILEDPAELWDDFKQCVLKTQAKTIFILLDNLEYMFDGMGEEDFKTFVNNLREVRADLKSSDKRIKVLVTCSRHLPIMEKHFKDGVFLVMNHPSSRRC
ncbi:hypothetical protein PG993_006090 [Apiospora rasikravindrae]|uniref:Uncharacterized protein n=1 Tax=Apiospora rasikravindrae TaxID=990691 RepID=A0ABR1TAM0_9PEZI